MSRLGIGTYEEDLLEYLLLKGSDLEEFYVEDMPIQFLLSSYRRYAWWMLKEEWEKPKLQNCPIRPLGVVLDKYPTSDRIDALVFWSNGEVSSKIFAVGKEGPEIHKCGRFTRMAFGDWIVDLILEKYDVYVVRTKSNE
jgi:hypothetical protein